jgi:signal transduction histidine kinase
LEISTSYQPDRKRPLLVRFTDTGPGIHKQLWEKIFELGFSTRGGSGLGLFIARSFIEMFDGRIKVEESAVPLGTTFLVKLPV